jgi:cytochrome P450
MWEVVEHLHEHCPVAHSDGGMMRTGAAAPGGMWVVTKHEDVLRVLQDWRTFSSDFSKRAQAENAAGDSALGEMPPISSDPPLHRQFRLLLNPHFTPQVVAAYEPYARRVVTELIDGFIEGGHCDLIAQLTRLFPSRMFFRVLFGIEDDAEVERCLEWADKVAFEPDAPDMPAMMVAWTEWIHEFCAARRVAVRRDDVIDALIHGTVEDRVDGEVFRRPLTDDELVGAIRLLILGGFETTSDATGSVMLKLVEHPELQDMLRRRHSLIPTVCEEILRLEPPVISLARMATEDVEMRGQLIKAGDMVLMHFGGANRDAEEFDRPTELDIDRKRNRHLAFGGGVHRCVGSNLARLNLRVVFEEILDRMHDIRITPGETPERGRPSVGWGLGTLPLTFTPGPKLLG